MNENENNRVNLNDVVVYRSGVDVNVAQPRDFTTNFPSKMVEEQLNNPKIK